MEMVITKKNIIKWLIKLKMCMSIKNKMKWLFKKIKIKCFLNENGIIIKMRIKMEKKKMKYLLKWKWNIAIKWI